MTAKDTALMPASLRISQIVLVWEGIPVCDPFLNMLHLEVCEQDKSLADKKYWAACVSDLKLCMINFYRIWDIIFML